MCIRDRGIFSWTINSLIIITIISDFCLKQGIKNQNSVLNKVGNSAIFVLNRDPRIYRVPPPPLSPGAQNQGCTLQFKCKEGKKQEMEYVAHITLLIIATFPSTDTFIRHSLSSRMTPKVSLFSIFCPLTKVTSKL